MDVLETWYSRLDEADYVAMLPKYQKAILRKRIAKATASSSAELVYPKLVETTAVGRASTTHLLPFSMRRIA